MTTQNLGSSQAASAPLARTSGAITETFGAFGWGIGAIQSTPRMQWIDLRVNPLVIVGLSAVSIAVATNAYAQTVAGFQVEPYAVVSNPVRISTDASNTVFVGRNPPTNQSGATSISRVACSGTPVTQSPNFSDPDVVIVDSRGLISGASGSVLIGGTIGNGQFRIVAWRPDGTTHVVLDYGGIDVNGFAFDAAGRLIIAADAAVYRFDGSQLVGLFSPTPRAQSVAVDSDGNFYVALENGNLAIYGSTGQLINSQLANFNNSFQIILTSEGQFGAGLFALDGTLWRVQNDGTKISLGSGFIAGSSMAFGPDGSLYVSEFATNRIMRVACKALLCTQPQPQVLCPGSTAVLEVSGASTDPLTFSWRKNGISIDPLSNPSAATNTLTLTNITASDAGSYDCIVTNACGSVTSNPVTLDVYCECPPYTQLGGVIDTPGFSQPADPAFPSSSLASALNNQNPRPLLNFDQIPGTTPGVSGDRSVAHTFTDIPNDLISASLRFRVRSGPNINPDGEGTDSMRLGFAVGSGETANFSGVNPARPYWTRFFGVGNATDAFFPGTVWGGSIDRSITLDLAALPRASQQGGGTINLLPEMLSRRSLDFVVSDDSGVDFAELTGIRTGGITVVWVREQPENTPVACPGSEAVFAITASGSAPFTYTWRKNGTPIDPLLNPSAATDTLTLTNITSSDIATYDCIVSNACGSVTSNPATLTICLGDFNCDGGINGEDIESFFTDWEAGNAAADINEDGGIDGSDVELFFLRWEAGC